MNARFQYCPRDGSLCNSFAAPLQHASGRSPASSRSWRPNRTSWTPWKLSELRRFFGFSRLSPGRSEHEQRRLTSIYYIKYSILYLTIELMQPAAHASQKPKGDYRNATKESESPQRRYTLLPERSSEQIFTGSRTDLLAPGTMTSPMLRPERTLRHA